MLHHHSSTTATDSLGPLLLLGVLLGEPVEHVGEGLLLLGPLRPDELRARRHPLLGSRVLGVQLDALGEVLPRRLVVVEAHARLAAPEVSLLGRRVFGDHLTKRKGNQSKKKSWIKDNYNYVTQIFELVATC